jgi:hypothetical protein
VSKFLGSQWHSNPVSILFLVTRKASPKVDTRFCCTILSSSNDVATPTHNSVHVHSQPVAIDAWTLATAMIKDLDLDAIVRKIKLSQSFARVSPYFAEGKKWKNWRVNCLTNCCKLENGWLSADMATSLTQWWPGYKNSMHRNDDHDCPNKTCHCVSAYNLRIPYSSHTECETQMFKYHTPNMR